MVSQRLYESLAGWLSEAMEKDYDSTHKDWRSSKVLRGLGRRGGGYQSWIETTLVELFEKYLCLVQERRVLAGEDGAVLYAYNGEYFEQVGIKAEKFIAELAKRSLRLLEVGPMYVQACPDKVAKSVVNTLTSSDEYLYKPDKRYIAFRNCVFDLRDGKPKAFNIRYNPAIVLDMDYMDEKECYKAGADKYGMADNPCRLWGCKLTGRNNGQLPGIMPNPEVLDAFQQWCGSLLVDPDVYQKEYVLYLVGPGANGKTLLAKSISAVFGRRYFSHFTPRQLFKDSDRGANIAALRGKLCNLVDDLSSDAKIDDGDYKRFASGQPFEARVPYEKHPVQVYAPPMLCCTNEMPEQRDNSRGNERRQLILHTTTYSFMGDEQDPELANKFATPVGRMWIFLWIYKGYRKVMANNGRIKLGDTVTEAIKQVMEHSNSLRRWYDEHRYVAVKAPMRKDLRWRSLKSLYEEYEEFAQEEGSEKRKRVELSAMLRQRGFSEERGNIRRMPTGVEYCVGRKGIDTDANGELIVEQTQNNENNGKD